MNRSGFFTLNILQTIALEIPKQNPQTAKPTKDLQSRDPLEVAIHLAESNAFEATEEITLEIERSFSDIGAKYVVKTPEDFGNAAVMFDSINLLHFVLRQRLTKTVILRNSYFDNKLVHIARFEAAGVFCSKQTKRRCANVYRISFAHSS